MICQDNSSRDSSNHKINIEMTDVNRDNQYMHPNDLPEGDCDEDLPPEDFICPITQQIFRDPVQDLFGHTYERIAILSWLSRNGTCPMTRKPMRASELIPNVLMKTKVRLWQREHGQVSCQGDHDMDNSIRHLYDTEDGDDVHTIDYSDEDGTVLVGYWSMAETYGSEDRARFRRGRRHHSRSNGTSHQRISTTNSRPVYFFLDDRCYDNQPASIPPLDVLLAEYDHIIQEEEMMTRRSRQQKEKRTRNTRRHRRASFPASQISTIYEQENTEAGGAQREIQMQTSSAVLPIATTDSELQNMTATSNVPGSRVRKFLFSRKS